MRPHPKSASRCSPPARCGCPRERHIGGSMSNNALCAGEIRVGGVRSPLLEGGRPESDEAVVFVHGNPGSSRDWTGLATAVAAFGRVVALDMPGFGGADKPPGFEYTVRGYARHLAGALAGLHIRRAHLVLHDFGGPWGLAWAATHPNEFATATLINTGVLSAAGTGSVGHARPIHPGRLRRAPTRGVPRCGGHRPRAERPLAVRGRPYCGGSNGVAIPSSAAAPMRSARGSPDGYASPKRSMRV